ncbi:unnamed protein product [Alternaria alternata]
MVPTESQQQRTLVLDLGDVLFHWSSRDLTVLSPQVFHSVILSPTWVELERDHLEEAEALKIIEEQLSIDPGMISEALTQCRRTLCVDNNLIERLKNLKAEMNGRLKVYAMSNIAREDFARLQAVLSDWSLFDGVFTSFEAGMTKFELGFFEHVLDSIGCRDPTSVIFVDDKSGQVNTARSFGMQGIVFESPGALMRQLRNQLFDPVIRARRYMTDNAGKHVSRIEDGPELNEFFSQFIIHWELEDASLLSLSPPNTDAADINATIEQASKEAKIWNYFNGPPIGTTKTFPDDVDDTANALLVFSPPASSANPVLDCMLKNRHAQNGLILTYFCDKRPRLDPIVITNVIRVFY